MDSVEELDRALAAENAVSEDEAFDSEVKDEADTATFRPDGFVRAPEFGYHHYDDLK